MPFPGNAEICPILILSFPFVSATIPDFYQKASSLGVSVAAVVRLIPVLQSTPIPGF